MESTFGESRPIHAADILRPVQVEMEEVEAVLREEVAQADVRLVPLLQDASLLRGKGLRPGLVLLTARATGTLRPDHIRLAATLEMIHNATLIHDDILDEATARRNRMTINLKYNNEVAVLVGDYLFARAFVMASSFSDSDVVAAISRMTAVICRGEIKQVVRRYDASLSEDAYQEVIAEKTASLYQVAGELGARLAGASPEIVLQCAAFGLAIGVAFQIVDDCLDLVGEESVMGKTLATDLDKGKLTLPVIHYLNTATPARRQDVLDLIESSAVSREEKRRRVLEWLEEAGALDYAFSCAREETRRAREVLARLEPSPARESLEKLTRFVVQRQV